MAQSLSQLYVHIVYSTKERRQSLQDQQLRSDLHAYIAGICSNHRSSAIAIGGVADHVHTLCQLSRTLFVADLVREMKRDSSKWIKTKRTELANFDWQNGYGAFSISPGHVDALKRYIANQEQHHMTESFQEEYRRLLAKYAVEYQEEYVWG